MTNENNYQVGLVKWFGGYNNRTERENDYGFIQSMTNEDLFIHKNEVQNETNLKEGDIVIFNLNIERERKSAVNAFLGVSDLNLLINLYKSNKNDYSDFFKSSDFENAIKGILQPSYIIHFNELDFLNIIKLFLSNNFFNQLDNYIYEKGDLSENLTQFIIDNYSKIKSRMILQSKNVSKFLGNNEIVKLIKIELESSVNESSSSKEEISPIRIGDLNEKEISILIKNKVFKAKSFIINSNYINYCFENIDDHSSFFKLLKKESNDNPKIYESIKETKYHYEVFQLLIGTQTIKSVLNHGLSLDLIPQQFVNEQEESLFDFILKSTNQKQKDFIDNNIESLPNNIINALIFHEIINDDDYINSRRSLIFSTAEKTLKINEDDNEYSHYLAQSFTVFFGDYNNFSTNETLKELQEELRFKSLLYQKDVSAGNIYNNSTSLKSRIDYFILGNIFPLLLSGNNETTTYKIFEHRIWMAMAENIIDPTDHENINKLFPSCDVMGDLSCEAFYWSKIEEFLCRRHKCHNPQILPDIDKHFLDYNIYDWFYHYDIRYLEEGEPQSKDFPIKLAGFFNRIREIFDIIHCRECQKIMTPNFKYARVEYLETNYETGQLERRDRDAAYRTTVFRCGDSNCSEQNKGVYINHCIESSCYGYIDSRDLTAKCPNDLYICNACYSCCITCIESGNPNGWCLECGTKINIYEKGGERFAYCSTRDCFSITTRNLHKKFKSNRIEIRRLGNNPNSRRGNNAFNDDDLPF